MEVYAVMLLACLHTATGITPPKVPDNAVGFSRIVVATPGMRRYTYDISHDPQGRDFSVRIDPVDPMTNFLPEAEPRFLPGAASYPMIIPVNEEEEAQQEEIQLNVKHPTQEEMEKSSREIQSVHSAYSKKPPEPAEMLEDFDLGIMGYGDFMDSHDDPGDYPVDDVPPPPPPPQVPGYGYRPSYPPPPKAPFLKKPVYPKLAPQKGIVEKVQNPKLQFPLTFQKALFMPAFDEGRLNGLADKAYSKVFMAHGFSKPVPRFYPKHGGEAEGINMAKTLFVPVVIVPSTQQSLVANHNIDRNDPALFEPRKIVTKRA